MEKAVAKKTLSKKTIAKKKVIPRKKIDKKVAIATGITGVIGLATAYHFLTKPKDPKKLSDKMLKKERDQLQKIIEQMTTENNTFGNNILSGLANTLNIPYSPVSILQQKKYNKIVKRKQEITSEIKKRKEIKKQKITKELDMYKAQIKDIQTLIDENQRLINGRLWQEGILVYNGISAEPEESVNDNKVYRNAIEKLKESSTDIFKKIKELEKALDEVDQ